jgi:hypothetical protein
VGSPKKTTTTNASVPTNTESVQGQTSAGDVTTSQTSQQAKHYPKAAKPTPPQPQPDPKAVGYIKTHNDDLNTVNADITLAELALIPAVKSASGVNLEKLAEAAQKAHDDIDGIRDDFAANTTTDTSSTVGQAEVNIWAGANDLKNSMGQLVAVAGSPDPETVAQVQGLV